MNLKTTITGLLGFIWTVASSYGLEVSPQVQTMVLGIFVAVACYFAKDAQTDETE